MSLQKFSTEKCWGAFPENVCTHLKYEFSKGKQITFNPNWDVMVTS